MNHKFNAQCCRSLGGKNRGGLTCFGRYRFKAFLSLHSSSTWLTYRTRSGSWGCFTSRMLEFLGYFPQAQKLFSFRSLAIWNFEKFNNNEQMLKRYWWEMLRASWEVEDVFLTWKEQWKLYREFWRVYKRWSTVLGLLWLKLNFVC